MTQRTPVDLSQELKNLFLNMTWNIQCILDADGNRIPVPKNSTCITAILEQAAIVKLENWATPLGISLIHPTNTREYPDATLQGTQLGNKIVAVDIKTGRRDPDNPNHVGAFTIGSYAGYFLHPDRKQAGCRIAYGTFSEHWIVGFIYDWDDTQDTLHMVSNIETIVAQKWKIASRRTGTGTTKHIASVTEIERLRSEHGEFQSEDEFEQYWRDYATRHHSR